MKIYPEKYNTASLSLYLYLQEEEDTCGMGSEQGLGEGRERNNKLCSKAGLVQLNCNWRHHQLLGSGLIPADGSAA